VVGVDLDVEVDEALVGRSPIHHRVEAADRTAVRSGHPGAVQMPGKVVAQAPGQLAAAQRRIARVLLLVDELREREQVVHLGIGGVLAQRGDLDDQVLGHARSVGRPPGAGKRVRGNSLARRAGPP
jgi:hypothetical protein